MLDAFLISTAAGIAVAFLLGQIQPLTLRLGGGVVLACSYLGLLAVGLVARWIVKGPAETASFTRASHSELIDDLPRSSSKMIEEADEIQVLAGTLIEFVRRRADMRALATAAARGAKVQIMMLDPDAGILRAIAAERSSRSHSSTEEIVERLRNECSYSIGQLQEALPAGTLNRILRLSSAMPHQAFSRYGECYLLAPYTFGRGGGSPAMFFKRSTANAPLCDGLQRGFEELWASSMVRKVTGEVSAAN